MGENRKWAISERWRDITGAARTMESLSAAARSLHNDKRCGGSKRFTLLASTYQRLAPSAALSAGALCIRNIVSRVF